MIALSLVLQLLIFLLIGMVKPDSSHVSMAFFLVPRGIDRILTGRELGAEQEPWRRP